MLRVCRVLNQIIFALRYWHVRGAKHLAERSEPQTAWQVMPQAVIKMSFYHNWKIAPTFSLCCGKDFPAPTPLALLHRTYRQLLQHTEIELFQVKDILVGGWVKMCPPLLNVFC